MPSVADRYFTREEVEALIPALTAAMERVTAAHAERAAIGERLEAEQQRIAVTGGGVIDREAWRGDRSRLEALAAEMRAGLETITAMGGTPKDLGLGLVDFAHLREGREVNLCWRLGEREVRFWHGLDEGYAARKPL